MREIEWIVHVYTSPASLDLLKSAFVNAASSNMALTLSQFVCATPVRFNAINPRVQDAVDFHGSITASLSSGGLPGRAVTSGTKDFISRKVRN